MMQAFARSAYSTCNLCVAEGKSFIIASGDDDEAWRMMEAHTALAHPEHDAFLEAGGIYYPVNPTVFDVMAGEG